MKTNEKQLFYLNELSDYKIEDNYPDVRGWDVKDAALRTIGKVKHLVVNKTMAKVVYLDVVVDSSIIDINHDPYTAPVNSGLREFMDSEGENHLIIPIVLADLNIEKEYVISETVDHNTFAGTQKFHINTRADQDYENDLQHSSARNSLNPADLHEQERLAILKRSHNIEK